MGPLYFHSSVKISQEARISRIEKPFCIGHIGATPALMDTLF
jgi:hypothetical protein